jgi:hypothetical protein
MLQLSNLTERDGISRARVWGAFAGSPFRSQNAPQATLRLMGVKQHSMPENSAANDECHTEPALLARRL